ncbi:recombinase family protein [Streptomyces sp. ISL-36]|uniref:recombinase family protein n=1 Tax=Streptomyces sp. ISL-36 TaxID=2819182 RepID=UPI002034B264|nr:recombinase family protein [Streptomyces sp. ISL-36]
MADLVYKRVSTDQQSTDRQDLVLAEAGIEDPTLFEEEVGISRRLHPERPKFGELLAYARPGDTVHIFEMFRLVRGTGHILDWLDVLQSRPGGAAHPRPGVLRDHLTARPPRSGELLPTAKFMVPTLAAADELQRDLQRELTYDGLRAARPRATRAGADPPSPPRRPVPSHRVPGGPVHRGPRPRPRRQPRCHPYRRRLPPARVHGRRPGRPGPGPRLAVGEGPAATPSHVRRAPAPRNP